MQHTFLVHFFAVVLHDYKVKLPETSQPAQHGGFVEPGARPAFITQQPKPPCYAGQKLLSYTFYGGNIIRVLVPFFSLLLIFTLQRWRLAFLIIFVRAATKFSCCSFNKKLSHLFSISRSRSLSPFFSLSLPPTFSFSLSFSCFIFCGHDY